MLSHGSRCTEWSSGSVQNAGISSQPLVIEPEPGCSAPIAHLRAPGQCCTTTDGVPEKRRGSVRLIRSGFWPPCFNDFCKPFVALGDGDATVSRAALRKAGSLVPPLLGALPVSFGIPTIRHQNLYLTDVHGVAHFGRREFDQIATYGELATARLVCWQWTPENCARKQCITGGSPGR